MPRSGAARAHHLLWVAPLAALAACAAPTGPSPSTSKAIDWRAICGRSARASSPIIDCPSPTSWPREQPISMIVLHYTGMADAPSAVARLRDPRAKVSCHYLVTEQGVVLRMVPEHRAAAHAGDSSWRGVRDVNAASIGIEIANPGNGTPFADGQMAATAALVANLVRRHGIAAHNVVGHSDVAPHRKQDPGEAFDWPALARAGFALPTPRGTLRDPRWSNAAFVTRLNRFGYDTRDPAAATRAFQRRFRPMLVTGRPDPETRALLAALSRDMDRPQPVVLASR